MHSKSIFSSTLPAEKIALLKEVDAFIFQEKSLQWMKQHVQEKTFLQWQSFIKNLKSFSDNKSECLLLMKRAFLCTDNKIESGELAQFATLFRHLKSLEGMQLIHALLKASINEYSLELHIRILQLLLDLHEAEGIFKLVKSTLPDLSQLLEKLQNLQEKQLATRYPKRNIDTVIAGFLQKNDLIQFPLEQGELASIKQDYLAIQDCISTMNQFPQSQLAEKMQQHALQYRKAQKASDKQAMFAILCITLRRIHKISAYDTQMIALLALINKPEKMKGRIGQIKTGEGKSTIIAMLCAFMASQEYFVDMVTSSGYLAMRDCQKYRPFFAALHLSVSHISYDKQRQEHFHARILYGTNTDFEFSMLRDGLYNYKLRYSFNATGQLIKRPYDVVIIDEVDNLFLDVALSSAQLGMQDYADISWIYKPVLAFAKAFAQGMPEIAVFRKYLESNCEQSKHQALRGFSDRHLLRWLNNARIALYEKMEKRDYTVDDGKIVIRDYAITGRKHANSQWQHGIHQFVQLKENCTLTPPSKTGASVSHPAYFMLYQWILGLTGTMGERIERTEIQQIYLVQSFDFPPHFPCIRQKEIAAILPDELTKWIELKKCCARSREQGRPVLILFKTIRESEAFSQWLLKQGFKHQLLNETQREAEDYLISRAGDAGEVTVATNIAGRGTDIILSPESKKNGGLKTFFTFYPDNLRVEEQGFGRSGRQGQPGSCQMILDMEDEFIQSLGKPFRTFVNGYFQKNPDTAEASQMMQAITLMLGDLRTDRIQNQSGQRIKCSSDEQHYFAELQNFFKSMEKICEQVDTSAFEQKILQVCRTGLDQEPIIKNKNLDTDHPHWLIVQETLRPLLEKQEQGISVDWTVFVKQFNEIFLDYIRDTWATYYSQLKDPIIMNKDLAFAKIDRLLKEPERMAMAIMQGLFIKSAQTLERREDNALFVA